MTRCVLPLCALLLTTGVGCRAPMPSLNVFAPYGPARVPAPCTGSYGAPATYYQPGSAAAAIPAQQTQMAARAGEGKNPASAQATWTSASSSSNGDAADGSESGLGVAEAPNSAALGSSEPPIRIVEAGAVQTTDQQARPATTASTSIASSEPAPFVPPSDARPLATTVPQQMVAPASFTTTSSNLAATAPSAHTSLASDRGWRSRYQPTQ